MQNVSKYIIPMESYFSLDLPKGAKILTVQVQRDELQLYAFVNKDKPNEKRNFRLVTSHPIKESPESLNYIGTFQIAGGNFIGHIFEIE